MLAEDGSPSPLSRLYHQVKTAMVAVHEESASQKSVDALLKVAAEWWVLHSSLVVAVITCPIISLATHLPPPMSLTLKI